MEGSIFLGSCLRLRSRAELLGECEEGEGDGGVDGETSAQRSEGCRSRTEASTSESQSITPVCSSQVMRRRPKYSKEVHPCKDSYRVL